MGYIAISPFRVTELKELPTDPWIIGCADWIYEWAFLGWTPYYVNIMFKPLSGSTEAIHDQMRRAIEHGFYRQFCMEFASHPRKPAQQARLPKLMLFPDRPCFKRSKKTSIREMQFNDGGMHWNGPMMIPPPRKFRGNAIRNIEENQQRYCVEGIDRIHVMDTTFDLDRLVDYVVKTLKRDHEAANHVILLPESRIKKPVNVLSPEQRAIRDIQSQHNVSDEFARILASAEEGKARNRVTDAVMGP